jgi:hypothetical protein
LPSIRTPFNRNRQRLITPDMAMRYRRLCEPDCPEREKHNLRTAISMHYSIAPWCLGLRDDCQIDEAGLTAMEVQAEWADALAEALEAAMASYVEMPP